MKKIKMLSFSGLVGAVTLAGSSLVSSDATAAAWFNCQALSVFEVTAGGTTQLEVECANEYQTGVNWVGVNISGTGSIGSSSAQRFTSMAQAAILSGRQFRAFMTDTACPGTPNCRIANAWSLYRP
jgi:hypothetical protein